MQRVIMEGKIEGKEAREGQEYSGLTTSKIG